MIVYRATCPEGRSYIGITRKTLEYRRRQHMRASVAGSSCKFHDALRLWGDQMEWAVLDTASSIQELRDKERDYIARFDSYAYGYNSSPGGEYSGLFQGERVETDGTVVQIFAPSEAGRRVGRNVTVNVDAESRPALKPDLQAIAKVERSHAQRESRRAKRRQKKSVS